MRYRATFIAGLAVGFVAGTRAGRERYEQLMRLGRKAADSPAMKQATRVASEKATGLTKVARDRATARVPKLTETARTGANRVRGRMDRIPGMRSGNDDTTAVNGTRPAD
jgi:hypothetical protein